MDKKRYIFDLDGTLLNCNYGMVEDDFFKKELGEGSDRFVPFIAPLLDEYEFKNKKYEKDKLCEFLSSKTNLCFTPEVIDGWIEIMTEVPDIMEEGVIETLEYLKSKDKSLVVLTNWFGDSQKARLKKAKIYDYFDDIYTGDYQLKPHNEAYLNAIGKYDIENCVLIGDHLYKDYIAPRSYGLESIFYDKKNNEHENIVKIKKINELTNRY